MDMIIAGAGGRIQMVYHKMSQQDVDRIIGQPFTMIASDRSIVVDQGQHTKARPAQILYGPGKN